MKDTKLEILQRPTTIVNEIKITPYHLGDPLQSWLMKPSLMEPNFLGKENSIMNCQEQDPQNVTRKGICNFCRVFYSTQHYSKKWRRGV